MKKIYFKTVLSGIITAFIFSHSASAQTWAPLGAGLLPDNIVYCYAINSFQNNIIAAGVFDTAGNVAANNIAAWNGTWAPLGSGFSPADPNFGGIYTLASNDTALFVGGQFDSAGGIAAANVVEWNGTTWLPLGTGIPGSGDTNYVNALIFYNGNLIAGGVFSNASPINMWNGSNWTSMNNNFDGAGVACFTIYNGDLYAGGYFFGSSDTIFGLAKWDGETWTYMTPISTIDPYGGDVVSALSVYNGNLIVGGNFDTIGGLPATNIAQWNGTTWSTMGAGILPSDSGSVIALSTYQGKLIAGGIFTGAGNVSASNIAQWDGNSWAADGDASNFGEVEAIYADSNLLFVAGYFTQIGGIEAHSIAEFGLSNAITEVQANDLIKLYPNPNNGNFIVSTDNIPAGYSMHIYSITGEQVLQKTLTGNNTGIDLSTAAKGAYLYRITGIEGESVATGRIIVQ